MNCTRVLLAQFTIHESQSGLAIFGSITLVGGSIVAIRAVRIGRITIALDLGRKGATREATRASVESTGSRGAHIERLSRRVPWISHPDDGLDLGLGS